MNGPAHPRRLGLGRILVMACLWLLAAAAPLTFQPAAAAAALFHLVGPVPAERAWARNSDCTSRPAAETARRSPPATVRTSACMASRRRPNTAAVMRGMDVGPLSRHAKRRGQAPVTRLRP